MKQFEILSVFKGQAMKGHSVAGEAFYFSLFYVINFIEQVCKRHIWLYS